MSQTSKYRYDTCPQCEAIARRRAAEAEAAAEAGYGRGTWQEFLAMHGLAVELRQKANALGNDAGPKSLRSQIGYGLSRGVGGVSQGMVCMEYEADCPHCGLAIARECASPLAVADQEPADIADAGY